MKNTTPSTAETAQAAPETTERLDEGVELGSSTSTNLRFQITDMSGVTWFLKKLLEKDAAAAAVQFELETIKNNCEAALKQIESDKAHFNALYAEQVVAVAKGELEAQGGRTKSITTPYGILGFREVPEGLVIENKKDAADHAVVLGFTKPTGDTAAYKAHAELHFDKTGEVLPGFKFKPREERFSIRNAKPQETEEGSEAE